MKRTVFSASILVAASLIAAPASALVINGDFEDVSSSTPGTGLQNGAALGNLATGPGASWDVYSSLPGWTTATGRGIEIQTNRTLGSINSHNGGQHYVELDSHGASSNSSMEQSLTLAAGLYEFSFYFSPRTSNAASNGIDYSIDGDTTITGNITGPGNGTQVGQWTQVVELFSIAADDTLVTMTLAATGNQDSLGGFVDSVSLSRIGDPVAPAVPLPATALLLLGALGGFGALRRRG